MVNTETSPVPAAPEPRVRRATVDDLPALIKLWKLCQLNPREIEKRVTDFQLVETAEGRVAGCIGLRIAGLHGNIHSECFRDFGEADRLRPLLWNRLKSVAQNHGLARLWTRETGVFWHQEGLRGPTPTELERLPAELGEHDGKWCTLQLRDEDALSTVSLDKEFAVFREVERERTERIFQQARFFKLIATLVAALLLIFVIVGGYLLWKKGQG
jgi:N-acetylglutamate synthase-like GNAT family acetyltransferase